MWDTNIAIYYLQQQFPQNIEKIIDDLVLEEQHIISAITEIELLCWKSATEKDLEVLQSFIADALVNEMEQAIKFKTAELLKTYTIKLPNGIIAATAVVYDLTLLTRNSSDFEHIHGLKLLNPWNQS